VGARSKILVLLSLTASLAAAASYETPRPLKASDLLPAALLQGPRFKVQDAVGVDGYMTSFTVQSDFGPFVAGSREMLEVRILEVYALAKLEDVSRSEVFAKAFAASAKKKGAAVAQVVTNPVETAEKVPEGVGRFFKGVGKAAKQGADAATDAVKKDDKPAESSQKPDTKEQVEGAAKDLAGVNRAKREWAKKLGVDPYTTNPVLAKKLDDVAWAAYAGGLTLSIVMPPIPGLTVVEKTSDLVWSTPPQDLAQQNDAKLKVMGVPEETRKAFLQNRAFAPVLQAGIVTALDSLAGVAGRVEAVTLATRQAKSELDARFYVRLAQMLADHHQKVAPLASLISRNRIFLGKAKAGGLVVAAPLDYLFWTAQIEEFSSAPELRVPERNLLLLGRASPTAKAQLTAAGWSVKEGVVPR
jgi:hypothetical protein